MAAYYNENDPAAAHVLRAMIADGVIAPGDVDTRSIKEVEPDDLAGYTQCHFFAGGGLWSVAARLAGWPDDRELWTGSCPCQPFSAAGKGLGTDDPRHLWPDFHRLIRARRPAVVMGEQVAGKAGYGWFDGVRADLAGEGYAGRAVDFPACSVDAPHQRNRLYWIAMEHAAGERRGEGWPEYELRCGWPATACADASDDMADGIGAEGRSRGPGSTCSAPAKGEGAHWAHSRAEPADAYGLHPGVTQGDAFGSRLEGQRGHGDRSGRPEPGRSIATPDGSERCLSSNAVVPFVQGQPPARHEPDDRADAGVYASLQSDANGSGRDGRPPDTQREPRLRVAFERLDQGHGRPVRRNGTFWSDAEWIECHDEKARRAKPGIRFLVDGLPGRVDLWRIGGNAIVPEAAAEVIAAFMDAYGVPALSSRRAA